MSGCRTVARLASALSLIIGCVSFSASAHDIPNARVDRSIQVTIEPGAIRVRYEVSLAELTLTQELRNLIGKLPGADRAEWFAAYGRETGPLDARGILVRVGEDSVPLKVEGFDLIVEEHPRFTFRFSGTIPDSGDLTIRDTNYRQSEGTSRLAIRGNGVTVKGDTLPSLVEDIPELPVWQLSDEEERRTHEVRVEYQSGSKPATETPKQPVRAAKTQSSTLSNLVDRASTLPLAALAAIAFGLGAAHALQPGHGKTLVVATMLGEGSTWSRGAALALITTITHLSSVLILGAILWWTESTRFPEVHLALTRGSGFLIAAVGAWRLGRILGGNPEPSHNHPTGNRSSLLGLGIAGGIVPCWDAVGLIVLSAAVEKVGLGIILVGAFSLGMGLVLVLIGVAASAFRSSWEAKLGSPRLEQALSLASGLFLTAIGVYLLSV